jgi:hypothetical protein
MFKEGGVDIGNNYTDVKTSTQKRPEMKGPQNDVDDILSGLKIKTLNIHENSQNNNNVKVEDESMVSIASLRDMANMSVPKKTNRRKSSEKNTISLGDI